MFALMRTSCAPTAANGGKFSQCCCSHADACLRPDSQHGG